MHHKVTIMLLKVKTIMCLYYKGKYSKNELYSKTKNLPVLAHKSLVCFGLIILHGMVSPHHTSVDRDPSHPYIHGTKFGLLA